MFAQQEEDERKKRVRKKIREREGISREGDGAEAARGAGRVFFFNFCSFRWGWKERRNGGCVGAVKGLQEMGNRTKKMENNT